MPTVPVLDRRVQQEAIPGVRVNTEAPLSAFGGGRTVDAVTEAGNTLISSARKIIEEEKKKADDVQNLASKNALSQLSTQLQYGDGGFLTQKGDQIKGLPDRINENWNKGVQDIRAGLNNDEQRAYFDKYAGEHYSDLNKDLQRHLYTESKAYDKDQTQSYVKIQRDMAANKFDDPEAIGKSLSEQMNSIDGFAQRNREYSPESIQLMKLEATSNTHSDVINRTLMAKGGIAAKSYYDSVKDQISPETQTVLEAKLQKEVANENGEIAWQKVKNFKLSDGLPDERRMENYVMSQPGFKTEDKIYQLNWVKARAAEDTANTRREKEADHNKFMSDLVTMRKDGKSLAEAIQYTGFATKGSAYDLSIREDAARKMWAPPTQSNPQVYIGLWEKIQDGNGNQKELDGAMQKGDINFVHWEQLRKDLYNNQNGSESSEEKSVNQIVSATVKKAVGDDQIAYRKMLFQIQETSREKNLSPEQKLDYVNKLMNDRTKMQGDWFIGTKNWRVNLNTFDQNTKEMADLHNTIGQDETAAISKALQFQGTKKVGAADINSFAAQFGGAKNLAPGTSSGEALRILTKQGLPPTRDNIRYVESQLLNRKK